MRQSTRFYSIMLAFLLLAKPNNSYAEPWTIINQPTIRELSFLKVSNVSSPVLFVAGNGDLLISGDEGKTWKRTLRLRGSGIEIHDVKVFRQNPDDFYALTTEGLFLFNSRKKNWEQLYRGIGEKNRNVLSFAQNPMDPNLFYMGTERGVLISKDRGRNWSSAFAELGQYVIFDIVVDESNWELYFATNRGIYRYHLNQDSFRLVFSQSVLISEEDEFENSDSDSENFVQKEMNELHLVMTHDERYSIVIAGKQFVAVSNDEGETWEPLPRGGLDLSPVVDLVYSESLKTLLIATERSVFQFDEQEKIWKQLYEGLLSTHIHSLAIKRGKIEKLFAATQNGIFTCELKPEIARVNADTLFGESNSTIELNRTFAKEPNIRDVQEAAIRYADVSNSKIKRWHYQSRIRSLLPSITFTKDLDISNNIHTDTGSTTTPDLFVQGPDERDKSTDFDLSWDLGDLIFNSSQTSIDSRGKLMVELRDEILAEVTRLYYERRRAQLDFFANPPAEPVESVKAQMRIEELTANLDALTGGYFSKRLLVANSIHRKL